MWIDFRRYFTTKFVSITMILDVPFQPGFYFKSLSTLIARKINFIFTYQSNVFYLNFIFSFFMSWLKPFSFFQKNTFFALIFFLIFHIYKINFLWGSICLSSQASVRSQNSFFQQIYYLEMFSDNTCGFWHVYS